MKICKIDVKEERYLPLGAAQLKKKQHRIDPFHFKCKNNYKIKFSLTFEQHRLFELFEHPRIGNRYAGWSEFKTLIKIFSVTFE